MGAMMAQSGSQRDAVSRQQSRGASMASGSPPVQPAAARSARRYALRHPVNRAVIEEAPFGARVADRVTDFLGSWKFIAIQTVFVAIWIAGNVILLFNFDPFPFILLNLAFSTQAAYAAPLILLAGNRHALRDRLTLEHAASEADIEEKQNVELLQGNRELAEGNRQILERIEGLARGNRQVVERTEGLEQRILELETSILGRLDQLQPPG
jgi:uncharacterized membrane protein